jgi:hypothetical protein
MADVLDFELQVKLVPLEMTCGHTIYVSKRMDDLWRKSHEAFWCCFCGHENSYQAPIPKVEAPPPQPPKKSVGEKIVQLFGKSRSE